MGIRLNCPNGHKLHVKSFLAGRRGVCPHCGSKFEIPSSSPVSADDAGTDEIVLAPSIDPPADAPAASPVGGGNSAAAIPSSTAAAALKQDSGGAVWYLRHPIHGHFGPADWETLRRWAAEDRISADSLVWREGWPDWKPASSLLPSLTAAETSADLLRDRDPLDLGALTAASGSAQGGHPYGAAAQRFSARQKNARTMRIVSIVLAAAVTLLACVLLFILMR